MTGEPIAGNPMADDLIERVARAICLTQGEDPETLDMHRYCDANNQPMPLWNWYAEQAEAAISVISCPSITADASGYVSVPLAHAMVVTEIANRNEQSSSGDIMRGILTERDDKLLYNRLATGDTETGEPK